MKSAELQNLMSLALNIAKDASEHIKPNIKENRFVKVDLDRDVKIYADFKLDSFILERLSRQSDFRILSEESREVGDKSDTDDYLWIVDLLDGSLNFSRGIPMCCISIALWKGMEPVLGVVYDLFREESFYGLVDEGAWLNEMPIRVSTVDNKSKAILCTGFPVSMDFSKGSLLDFVEQIKSYEKVRLFGSAALSLAYASCGRVDAYQENYIKI